ncbi:MAG: hypothetical protein HY348_09505 [Nitrospira defluvii]|nr:hypothetical protein [Nitrospira defluvii]
MKTMKRGSGVLLGLLWVLIADVATAGNYTLVVGKGIEVCQAYLRNLHSFPMHPPVVCERPLNPKLSAFSRPKWKPLEFWPNRHLLRQALRQRPSNLQYSDEEYEKLEPYDKWESNIRERMKERNMTLATAELDVDQDGKKDIVLRFDTGWPCDPMDEGNFAIPGGIELYVLTPDGRGIDGKSTYATLPVRAGRPDVVGYKGKWYVTTWAGDMNFTEAQLDIITVESVPRQRCQFKYTGQAQRRHP